MKLSEEQIESIRVLLDNCIQGDEETAVMCDKCGGKSGELERLKNDFRLHDYECSYMSAKCALEGKDLYALWEEG